MFCFKMYLQCDIRDNSSIKKAAIFKLLFTEMHPGSTAISLESMCSTQWLWWICHVMALRTMCSSVQPPSGTRREAITRHLTTTLWKTIASTTACLMLTVVSLSGLCFTIVISTIRKLWTRVKSSTNNV